MVKWSFKGRLGLALFIPVLAWLSWYSFTSATHSNAAVGYLAVVGALFALGIQAHVALFRVDADERGITERSLRGRRFFPWSDVMRVEAIAQRNRGGRIERWEAAPEDAFHIILHFRNGRVNVHRWMTGVDALIVELRTRRGGGLPYRAAETSALERGGPKAGLPGSRSPAAESLNRVYDAMVLVKAAVVAMPLSWFAGFLFTLLMRVSITDNVLVDATLLALLPWAFSYVTYLWVKRVRRSRFGEEYARPNLTLSDAIMTIAAAMGGPLLLVGFIPRVIAEPNGLNFLFCLVGLFFCWVPVAEIRKALRVA